MQRRKVRNLHNQVKKLPNVNTSSAFGIAAEVQGIIRAAAEPWRPGDSVKAGLVRATRALGLSYSRARSGWYGRAVAWRASEVDALRRRRDALLQDRQRRLEAELATLKAMLDAGAP